MIRKVQVLAMALSLSVLMAASSQAAPVKQVLVPKPSLEVGIFAEVWAWLSSWLGEHAVSPPQGPNGPESTSQIDPNGQH